MTDEAGRTDFDPDAYWESRLAERYTLGSTGWSGLGESFNKWPYAVRRVNFGRVVHDVLPDRSTLRVLDVGSGTGFYLNAWKRLGAGSDLTSTAVERLRVSFPQSSIHRFDIGDSRADLPQAQFDAISISGVCPSLPRLWWG